MEAEVRKNSGAYYTPPFVAKALVRWAVRNESDLLLDPSCGDGEFLANHPNSVGVDLDASAAEIAKERAPLSKIITENFFVWVALAQNKFDCVTGNPPFIRYQRFAGESRRLAIEYCERLGVKISGLTSSWAPFIVAAASLLKPRGRLAFVVPAEIGHAPYAKPLIQFLLERFGFVHVIAVKEKLFPDLSEDVWLLYAEEYGNASEHIHFSTLERFDYISTPPKPESRINKREWRSWGGRIRPFILPQEVRDFYRYAVERGDAVRLGDIASVGIGYVTGANDFFHLTRSDARKHGIPDRFLQPTVRNGGVLRPPAVTKPHIQKWIEKNEPVLLLRLRNGDDDNSEIARYLDTEAGQQARETYKCRNRNPWYVVPDVPIPDGFLSYMSSAGPVLVANEARCSCTNSVHAVRLKNGVPMSDLVREWENPFRVLSCEVEGHPLGGGMLKLEPREAAQVAIPNRRVFTDQEKELIQLGISTMRQWRHYDRKE